MCFHNSRRSAIRPIGPGDAQRHDPGLHPHTRMQGNCPALQPARLLLSMGRNASVPCTAGKPLSETCRRGQNPAVRNMFRLSAGKRCSSPVRATHWVQLSAPNAGGSACSVGRGPCILVHGRPAPCTRGRSWRQSNAKLATAQHAARRPLDRPRPARAARASQTAAPTPPQRHLHTYTCAISMCISS